MAGFDQKDTANYSGDFFLKLSIPYFLKKVYITTVNEQCIHAFPLLNS